MITPKQVFTSLRQAGYTLAHIPNALTTNESTKGTTRLQVISKFVAHNETESGAHVIGIKGEVAILEGKPIIRVKTYLNKDLADAIKLTSPHIIEDLTEEDLGKLVAIGQGMKPIEQLRRTQNGYVASNHLAPNNRTSQN